MFLAMEVYTEVDKGNIDRAVWMEKYLNRVQRALGAPVSHYAEEHR